MTNRNFYGILTLEIEKMKNLKRKVGEKMIKVRILDDTGHTELLCATLDEVKQVVKDRQLEDKFVFADGKFTNIVTLDGVTELPNELVFTERLIGG